MASWWPWLLAMVVVATLATAGPGLAPGAPHSDLFISLLEEDGDQLVLGASGGLSHVKTRGLPATAEATNTKAKHKRHHK
jgi:hypothetical protein